MTESPATAAPATRPPAPPQTALSLLAPAPASVTVVPGPAGPVLLSLGIDPGLRNTGIAAVARRMDGTFYTQGVRVLRTEPTKDKAFARERTANDDVRRVRELWTGMSEILGRVKPHCMGVENYTVYIPPDADLLEKAVREYLSRASAPEALIALRTAVDAKRHTAVGLGQAAKTIMVLAAALSLAFGSSVPVSVFQPADVKKRFCARRSASKADVGVAVEQVVEGLGALMLERVPQTTLREHAWDASAHAVLAAEEFVRTHGAALVYATRPAP